MPTQDSRQFLDVLCQQGELIAVGRSIDEDGEVINRFSEHDEAPGWEDFALPKLDRYR